jgi:PAS domain S-box-containing protein
MNADQVYRRYQQLQSYVGWAPEDARRVAGLADLLAPHFRGLIDDFYAEIERHPRAARVITGGAAQIERLKGTLTGWLRELFSGTYDADYVARRWRVGWRHVEIGLEQVYTNVALSRLRAGLCRAVLTEWPPGPEGPQESLRALNSLLDLDLALIEDAYQAERVAREKASSDEAFRTLVEAAPCLIVILRPDHTVAYVNRYAEGITGRHAGDILGKDFVRVFLAEEGAPLVVEHLKRALAGEAVRALESPVLCEDGTRRWVLWNAERLPAYEGGPAVLAVGQDITARKLAQEKALQAERLAAIGQMMTGLAHESGNALARSQACLEMLVLEVQDRPEALELLGRIQKAQDHLQQLYDEVRNYAAPLKLEREPWSLDAIWRQAWANLAVRRQGREATLREDVGGLGLHCFGDPFRLEQVFRNVFDNSLAACKGSVELLVRAREARLDGAPAVRVEVCDNGPGLSAEQRRRIFEPFFTTKTKGTGLGMAIARRIVEAHGGQITVGPGHALGPTGAEIHITLPRDST